jgi:hypothetical protein
VKRGILFAWITPLDTPAEKAKNRLGFPGLAIRKGLKNGFS